MPFCIQCGQPNSNQASFCLSCGGLLFREKASGFGTRFRHRRALIVATAVGIAAMLIVFQSRSAQDKNAIVGSQTTSVPSTQSKGLDTSPVTTIVASTQDGAPLSQASGFIVTPDGLVATNYHVLKGARRAVAECCGGRIFDIASVEGADVSRDLLIVQLHMKGTAKKPAGLPHLSLSESKPPVIGERVLAIGSPQGLEQTVSDGIVSAVRDAGAVRYLQITAPLSPGSSGGPVLNSDGEVIGIVVAQFTTGQNLNFAVASKHLQPLLSQHLALELGDFQLLISRLERERHREERARRNE